MNSNKLHTLPGERDEKGDTLSQWRPITKVLHGYNIEEIVILAKMGEFKGSKLIPPCIF